MATGPYHHGDLRQHSLDLARKLIEQDGPNELTLRRLAMRAEVSHAALYRHFADRNALLDEVAAIWLQELVGTLSHESRIDGAVTSYVTAAVRSKELYRLVFSVMAASEAPATYAAIGDLRDCAARTFVVAGTPAVAVRDQVLRVWSTMHGMLDLYWHGLIRARSQQAAITYIVTATLAR
jgi:AcrR family transcriptional regulator